MFKVIVIQLAEEDIDEIFRWYEKRQINLGFEFIKELENAITSIEKNPFAFFNVTDKVRRIAIERFPYNIYYTIIEQTVYVHVIMHQHKAPEQWQKRIK